MYTVSKYPHGTFSWADTSSTDSAAAKQFYMDLFGWGKFDIPIGEGMTYTMFQHQGQNVAALSDATPEALEQKIPSHWSCYVTVDDVDALLPVVTANGGQIIYGPMDVFDSGRMAFLMDPTGAALGLWQARNHIGAGIVNTVGAMCWNELLTRDAETAKAFYSKFARLGILRRRALHPHQQSRAQQWRHDRDGRELRRYAALLDALLQYRRNQSRHRAYQRARWASAPGTERGARYRLVVGRATDPAGARLLHHAAIQG